DDLGIGRTYRDDAAQIDADVIVPEHPARNRLSEKERAAKIDRDGPVETVRAKIEQIAPDKRGHPGIVDEALDWPKIGFDRVEQGRMSVEIGEVEAIVSRTGAR